MRRTMHKVLLLLVVVGSLFCAADMVQAKTYYSTKQVGLTGKYDFITGQKYRIVSIKGNTVRYRTVTTVPTEYEFKLKFGKMKTAKLTSKTKYYIGDIKVFNNNTNPVFQNKKWITKVKKAAFTKALNGKGWWDRIIVKSGKVKKIFINMQLAG